MNGLEALEEIKGYKEVATLAGYVKQPIKKACKKEFAIIEKELKKLGELEDLENKLGIDLITLFKALKNGIYEFLEDGEYIKFITPWSFIKPHRVNISIKNKSLFRGNNNYYFKDYGKTWALTKEELEK